MTGERVARNERADRRLSAVPAIGDVRRVRYELVLLLDGGSVEHKVGDGFRSEEEAERRASELFAMRGSAMWRVDKCVVQLGQAKRACVVVEAVALPAEEPGGGDEFSDDDRAGEETSPPVDDEQPIAPVAQEPGSDNGRASH
jgi:hypothetical protein